MFTETKRLIRPVIKESVVNQFSLEDTKSTLCQNNGQQFFSRELDTYVDTKYIKYSLHQLQLQIKHVLGAKHLVPFHVVRSSLKSLLATSDYMCQIQSVDITGLTHFKFLNQALAPKNDEEKKNGLAKLKQLLIPDMITIGDEWIEIQVKMEGSNLVNLALEYLLDFKTQFVRSLSSVLEVCAPEEFELGWEDFLAGHRTEDYGKALSKEHDTKYDQLCDAISALSHEEQLVFNQWGNKFISIFSKPTIRLVQPGQIRYLIVSGAVIVLSQCLSQVERHLSHDNTHTHTEVHFLATNKFYIDANLESKIFRGRNILVVAESVECVGKKEIKWDVSGENGEDSPTDPPQRDENAEPGSCGESGQGAWCGENGGNITFIASKCIGIEKLSIYTNGGNGGNGQPGGNGYNGGNGKDGNAISFEQFQKDFETPVYRTGNKTEVLEKTVLTLREMSACIDEVSFEGFTPDGVKEGGSFILPSRNIFMRGDLRNGGEFEFSFSQWSIGRAAYLLLNGERGAPGEPGGQAGWGGKGGQGGFPGEVKWFDYTGQPVEGKTPNIYAKVGVDGKDAEDGQDGETGEDGEDGKDVGYAHNYTWNDVKYYQGGKYQVVSVDKKQDCSVYCDYKKSERYIEDWQPPKLYQEMSPRRHSVASNWSASAQKQPEIDMKDAAAYLQQLTERAMRIRPEILKDIFSKELWAELKGEAKKQLTLE